MISPTDSSPRMFAVGGGRFLGSDVVWECVACSIKVGNRHIKWQEITPLAACLQAQLTFQPKRRRHYIPLRCW
jgi:hypothetical protein